MIKKCITYGCTNHENEGRFIGNLCFPCYHIISTGEVHPTHAWFAKYDQYRRFVEFIANDYHELSQEKIAWQRDDWKKRAIDLLKDVDTI